MHHVGNYWFADSRNTTALVDFVMKMYDVLRYRKSFVKNNAVETGREGLQNSTPICSPAHK
jgi:hypothetical protein